MENHRAKGGSNSAKRKVNITITKLQMYRCNEQYLRTILQFPVRSGFFVNTYCLGSTLSLIMALRARQTTIILEMTLAFPFIGDIYIIRGKSGLIY